MLNRLVIAPHPLESDHIVSAARVGASLSEILAEHDISESATTHVLINGRQCLDLSYQPRAGETLVIAQALAGGGDDGGGKGILRVVAMIAVVAAAYTFAPYLAPGIQGAIGVSAATAANIAVASVAMVGSLAVNALIAPATPVYTPNALGGGADRSEQYFITGTGNQLLPWQVVPQIFGTMRFYPPLMLPPELDYAVRSNEINLLLDFGLNPATFKNWRLGNVELLDVGTVNEYYTAAPDTGYSSATLINQVAFNQALTTTEYEIPITGTDFIELSLMFSGLGRIDDQGNTQSASVTIELSQTSDNVNWQPVAEASGKSVTWSYIESIYANNSFILQRKTISQPTVTHTATATRFQFTAATLDRFVGKIMSAINTNTHTIRIKRLTAKSTSLRVNDGTTLIQLARHNKTDPNNPQLLRLAQPHQTAQVTIPSAEVATNALQPISVLVTTKLRSSINGVWQPIAETANPAWICLEILTGAANSRPLTDQQIDFAAWEAFAVYCDEQIDVTIDGVKTTEPRHECHLLVSNETTVQTLVNSILAQCQATLKISSGGQYSVLIDKAQASPVQLITPANSWDFNGQKTFSDIPHGLQIRFVNPALDYQLDSCTVYNDGYDQTNATKFESLDTVGVTSYQAAWRYGRYMLAQGTHRAEKFTVYMDVEYLAAARGDRVAVQHDVMSHGGQSGRVVSVSGDQLTLDFAVDLTAVTNAGGTIRSSITGGISTTRIKGNVNNNFNVVELDNPSPTLTVAAGDLLVVGEYQQVTHDYLVQKIEPAAELSARITLIKYEPAVYTAFTGIIPPFESGIAADLLPNHDAVITVHDVHAVVSYEHIDRKNTAKINIDWQLTGESRYLEGFTISMGHGEQLQTIATMPSSALNTSYSFNTHDRPDLLGDLQLKVTPVPLRGAVGHAGKTSLQILADTKPPKPPELFRIDVLGQLLDLSWRHADFFDTYRYELRYFPSVTATANDFLSSQALAIVDYNTNRITLGARIGTYFIRAIDYGGLVSAPVFDRVTVEEIQDIKAVAAIDDHATGLGGGLHGLVVNNGNLESAGTPGNYATVSTYNYQHIYDLGGIYEVRLEDYTKAHLEKITKLTLADNVNFDYWLEYRCADNLYMMDNWPMLDQMSSLLSAAPWLPWRRFDVTEITGRYIQFRMQLRQNDHNNKIVVTASKIQINEMKLIQEYHNQQVASGGLQLAFVPPFHSVPALSVSIDNATGDEFVQITQKDRTSVNLQLLKNGSPAAGQVDVVAVGFGSQRTTSL